MAGSAMLLPLTLAFLAAGAVPHSALPSSFPPGLPSGQLVSAVPPLSFNSLGSLPQACSFPGDSTLASQACSIFSPSNLSGTSFMTGALDTRFINSTMTNTEPATVCLPASRVCGEVVVEVDRMKPPAVEATGNTGLPAEWARFLSELKGFAQDVTTYSQGMASDATKWADLAQEWAFFTHSLAPYSSPLPTSRRTIDRYTDDVSSYASALSSFAAGIAATAEEAAESGNKLSLVVREAHKMALVALDASALRRTSWRSTSGRVGSSSRSPIVTGWSESWQLSEQVAEVSDSVEYVATYAADLAAFTGVWYENVEFLCAKDLNATSHMFPVCNKAQHLRRYADDVAEFAADWARSAVETDQWARDWTEYGKLYG